MIDLTNEESLSVLERGQVAHIGIVDDGEPYVTPLSYVLIDGDLYFRTGPGRRVDALKENPRCCVEITILREAGGWECVLFWGDARFVEDAGRQADVVAGLLRKYHTESPIASSSRSFLPEEHPIVAVTPEQITGRASGRDFSPKTRPGRL